MMGRSMLAYIPVNLANIIVSFGTIVILTRLLGPAEFGRYALAMITLQFVHMGSFTWLEAALARFQARAEREGDENSHLKTLYVYALGFASAGWILCMLIIWLLPLSTSMTTVLGVALTSTCLQIFFNLGIESHKASHRILRYSKIHTTQMLLSFTIGIMLIISTPLREVAPFIGIIIATIIVLMIDLPFMLKRMKGGKVQDTKAKTYFKYGMPICVSLLLTYALSSGDMFLITAFMGEAAAGHYNAGYNLANRSLDVLFVWIGMAVTPIAITALEKEGVERSTEILKDYGAILLWLSLPAATGIALVAEPAGFILGESVRAEAVKIMPLIAFAGVLNGLISYYAQRAFMLSGHTQMFVWAMVPPVILNIGLNIWLIPTMGLMGAVYATVAAYALGLVISIYVGRKYYPLPLPVRAFFEITFACIVMAGVVESLPLPGTLPDVMTVLVKAAVGIMVYGILCFGINAANCREFVKTLLAKLRKGKSPELQEVAS